MVIAMLHAPNRRLVPRRNTCSVHMVDQNLQTTAETEYTTVCRGALLHLWGTT
jgi:hypothetical protein